MTIDSVLVGVAEVEAQGLFENVDPVREEVLFVGRPEGETEERWVSVPAALSPNSLAGSLQSGSWTAARPAPPLDVAYRWRAIVWPNISGAVANEDLQLNGPDSDYVIARSEEWVEP